MHDSIISTVSILIVATEGVCDVTVEAVRTATGEPVMRDTAMQGVKKPKESGLQQDARAEKGDLGAIPIPVHPSDDTMY